MVMRWESEWADDKDGMKCRVPTAGKEENGHRRCKHKKELLWGRLFCGDRNWSQMGQSARNEKKNMAKTGRLVPKRDREKAQKMVTCEWNKIFNGQIVLFVATVASAIVGLSTFERLHTPKLFLCVHILNNRTCVRVFTASRTGANVESQHTEKEANTGQF